ncbi:MAG TPA: GntR family transcriptional regulator [Chloroflexota bacterium]|nr:GntR family transcriptional regulator [Chloroflexota bacterium]
MALALTHDRQPQTKQKFVYRTLRDAILRCDLAPGQRLITDAIARQLSVSHIPVREALQLLQAEGLVENIAHTGASVAPISRDGVVETFTVLEGLEVVATRTAAERMSDQEAGELAAIIAEMDAILHSRTHERWGDLNSEFHRAIARMTAMPLLYDMTVRALDQWDRIRRYYFTSVLEQRIIQSQHEHHLILDAMRRRDPATIEQLIKVHNQGAMAGYAAHLAGQPSGI